MELGADVWALNADNGTSWFDKDEKVKIDTKNKVEAWSGSKTGKIIMGKIRSIN